MTGVIILLLILLVTGVDWLRKLFHLRTLKKIAVMPRDILTNLPYTLKPAVIELRRQGIPIYAEWDAGGDSQCCSVKVGEVWGYEQNGNQISYRLAELIAQQLYLPYNGERYNKGQGTIEVNEHEQVVLCYSARGHNFDYEDDTTGDDVFISTGYIELTEDPFELHSYLHRVAITFSMYMGINTMDTVEYNTYGEWIQVRIWEGDDLLHIPVSEKMKQFYLDVLKKGLQPYEKEFEYTNKKEGEIIVTSIAISGRLEVKGIYLELDKSRAIIDSFKTNETVVLID